MDALMRPVDPLMVQSFVRLQLRFESATEPPQVQVLFSQGDSAWKTGVLAHVDGYRLPCWAPQAGPVTFVQEFSAKGEGWAGPLAAVPGRQATTDCRFTYTPLSTEGTKAVKQVTNIVALVEFHALTEEPKFELRALTAPNSLLEAIARHVKSYRLACEGAQLPRRGVIPFRFLVNGEDSKGFDGRTISVQTWMQSIQRDKRDATSFDFNTMSCPFTVQLRYLQPLMPNEVRQVGTVDPNRVVFLDWLRTHKLNRPPASQEALHRSTALIQVPCGTLSTE